MTAAACRSHGSGAVDGGRNRHWRRDVPSRSVLANGSAVVWLDGRPRFESAAGGAQATKSESATGAEIG